MGVILGHGAVAAEWKNRLLTELAVALAKAGAAPLFALSRELQTVCSGWGHKEHTRCS